MTRVLRVFSRLNIGGPSLHVIHLSSGLVRHGFETKLVVGKTDGREGDFFDLAEARGVRPEIIDDLGRAIHPARDTFALIRLYRAMRAFRPEIVHTHTAKAGALGRIAAKAAGVRTLVHTYHGHVLSGYFNPVVSSFFRRVESSLAPFTDSLLTVSESVKEDLVRLKVARADRVRVMPLGLDLEPLAKPLPRGSLRREAGWTDTARVVGIVGRLVSIKDLDTFLDAATIATRASDDLRFAIVGDGEERHRLEAKAAPLGNRVHFFGWRKDPDAVLGDMDLVVNTSLNEGTPVALIEALAAGRPVVATSVGGTPDLLDNGRFGTLVTPRSPEAVAAAMSAALAPGSTALARAEDGRKEVLRKYSVSRLVEDMAALYRSLLSERPAPRGRFDRGR
jgi:glycosyltransferase involved in cell wall biosynthesis